LRGLANSQCNRIEGDIHSLKALPGYDQNIFAHLLKRRVHKDLHIVS